MNKTISAAASFLEAAFDVLNARFFEGALSKPIITIQSSPKAYGHVTTTEAWADDAGNGRHELNIGAENLNRPVENIVATLVHEMVHLYCMAAGIKDTSRGNTYHNKRFKAEAERRGLVISHDQRIGYSVTEPGQEVKDLVSAQGWDQLGFARKGFAKLPNTKKPSSTRKYVCPSCGATVRATKDVHILCGDCMEVMVRVDSQDEDSQEAGAACAASRA